MSPPHADGAPAGHVVVGRIGKPFGLRGEVYVFADPDLDDPFDDGTVYTAGAETLVVERSRDHSGRLVVAFDGVTGREAAESLRGTILTRDRDELELDEDVVWVADLIGRTVVDGDGAVVGVVEAVADGHAHDYLRLARPDGGEAVVPLVADLIDWSVDPIVLTPLPGLLDPDEAL